MAYVYEQNLAPSKNSDNTRWRTPCLETIVVLGENEGRSETTRPETHFIETVNWYIRGS